MYTIPFYRATIYVLGILLGYALHTCKDYRLSEVSEHDWSTGRLRVHACLFEWTAINPWHKWGFGFGAAGRSRRC